ncbi:MAG: c-type cytochrome [Acidobacteriota bacterium]|nr:c-type cytochrome [Acidobacteriota bacterium]
MRSKWSRVAMTAAAVALLAGAGGAGERAAQAQGPTRPAAPGSQKENAAAVARGKYLVTAAGCHDCHTPWKMGANGPEPDMSLSLSGHPAAMTLPPPPAPSGPWIASSTATNTAWAGPWGISYTANLTPDPETGLGQWTEQQFIDTIRTGRRQGRGREILPPMPWPAFKNYNDADLKAIFAYLRSLPPMKNKVPDPVLAGAPK